MRRELVVFAAIMAVVLVVGLFGRSLVRGIAAGRLKSAFPGCDVSIGSAEIRNADTLTLSNIEVKKGGILYFRIRSLEINFSPLSLFTGKVPKVTVKNAYLGVDSPDKKLKEVIELPALKSGKGFLVRTVVISGLIVRLNTADWKLNAGAVGNIGMGKKITYSADIKLADFDLAFLAEGLNAAGKVDLTGTMTGGISLRGEDLRITEIKGDFATVAPGGSLIIKDEDFLKKLAENVKQPLDVIREGLKNYDFTEGRLLVSRDAESILFHILLDGAKGKRDLTVALHGF